MEHIHYIPLHRPWWHRALEAYRTWRMRSDERALIRATAATLFELSDATRRDIGLAESGRDAWPTWQVREIERSRF